VNNRLVVVLASLAFVALCWWSVARHTGPGAARSASAGFGGSAAAPQATAAAQPSLHVTQRDGRVILEGVLPNQTTRDSVLSRARTLYGADRIEDRLRVGAGLANAGWLAGAAEILPAFGREAPAASLIADGDTISLRGTVPSDDLKTKLVADANAAAGENVTVIDDLALNAPAAATPPPTQAPAAATAAPEPAKPPSTAETIARAVGGRCNQFDSGSAELTRDCERALDQVARALRAAPSARLIVEGHTDNIGAREVNRRISERRAKAVKAYLLAKGIDSHHAIAIGYGDSRPIADNATPDGRKKNRRIEFVVK
jgi:OOP family OmpA-OmpF porin